MVLVEHMRRLGPPTSVGVLSALALGLVAVSTLASPPARAGTAPNAQDGSSRVLKIDPC
jgi:hypothetical protein